MKAWKIQVDDDGGPIYDIVQAETRGKARSVFLRESSWGAMMSSADWIEIEVSRAPEFDNCDNWPPTAHDYLERDWTYPCDQCGLTLSLSEGDKPLFGSKDEAYCSQLCWSKRNG